MFSKDENFSNKSEQRGDLLSEKYAPFNNAKLDIWKEALLFAIGNVFTLSLITTIVSAILFSMNKIDKAGAASLISYSILFALLAVVVGLDYKKILPKFKSWIPYVVGLGFGLAILIFDESYLRFVNLFYNTGTGGN